MLCKLLRRSERRNLKSKSISDQSLICMICLIHIFQSLEVALKKLMPVQFLTRTGLNLFNRLFTSEMTCKVNKPCSRKI